jgi:hypothetical protein
MTRKLSRVMLEMESDRRDRTEPSELAGESKHAIDINAKQEYAAKGSANRALKPQKEFAVAQKSP